VTAQHLRLVMAREVLDFRRQRKVWRRLFLQPFAFLAILSVPVLLFQHELDRSKGAVVTVALQGDAASVTGLEASLSQAPLRLRHSDDAARDVVASAAEVGIVVPRTAAADGAAGRPVALRLLTLETDTASRLGGGTVAARLAEYRAQRTVTELRAAGLSPELAAPVGLRAVDLSSGTAEGTRFGIAQGLPALLVIQLFGLLSTAEERIAGAKDRRVLEPLLVLPIPRRTIVLGIGGASLAIGLLSSSLVFVPLTIGVAALVGTTAGTVAGPLQIVGAVLLGSALLGTFFVSLGVYAGARAHSGNEGSTFVTLAQITIFATLALTPFLAEQPVTGPLLAVPVVGPMLLIREGAAVGLPLVPSLTAAVATLAIARLLLARTTRLLDAETSVLRASR
jgi:sodium transport system permease protein